MNRIAVGVDPGVVAVSRDGLNAYVANQGGNSVSVVDTQAQTLRTTFPVGEFPGGLTLGADDSRLYVINELSNDLSVVDAVEFQLMRAIHIHLSATIRL